MQLFKILLQFLFVIESLLIINGLFFQSKQSDNKFIAAKYDANMPVPVRKVLEQDGDKEIIQIQLGRRPVQAVLTFVLNVLSRGKFNKKTVELGYDEIFHNYLLVTIENNEEIESTKSKIYVLEKAQRIRLRKPTYPDEFEDIYNIPLTPNRTLTLNRLITSASNIDRNFYSYDAANNNMCQTFVENIVDINGLSENIVDNATRIALKPQDAQTLIDTLGARKDIVKKITDLGGKVDQLINDKQIKLKAPPPKQFNLLDNMHIKVNEIGGKKVTNEMIKSTKQTHDKTATISGLADITIENREDIDEAVQALETNDAQLEKEESNWMLWTAIGIGIVLLSLIVSAIVYLFWQKQKSILNFLSKRK